MSSTVWLKLRNSKSGEETTLDDDYIDFTRVLPDQSKVCQKLKVPDICDFVDYSEAAEGEIADDEIPEFEYRKIADLITTLTALQSVLKDKAKSDAAAMLECCKDHQSEYDEVALIFIM